MSVLFLFLDPVEVTDGAGELDRIGELVPNFTRFGLDSPSSSSWSGGVGSVVMTLELWFSWMKLDDMPVISSWELEECSTGSEVVAASWKVGSPGLEVPNVLKFGLDVPG